MSVLVGHGDPAQQLTARCEHQRHLKDSGVDPALHVIHQHSATSARFIQALAQLARYKMDVAGADEEMGRAICAAVETRRATLDAGYAALELRHPLLTQAEDGEADSEGLLRRLADEEQAALARVATAEGAMPTLDELPRLHEDAWREHALARDQARQEQVHFAELRLEGLRARQRCLERALSGVREGAIELPELEGNTAQINVVDAIGEASQVRRTLHMESEACECSEHGCVSPRNPRACFTHMLELNPLLRCGSIILIQTTCRRSGKISSSKQASRRRTYDAQRVLNV